VYNDPVSNKPPQYERNTRSIDRSQHRNLARHHDSNSERQLVKAMNITEYKEMFAKVQAGQITEQAWFDYCFQTLSEIMEDNKDIFVRLKTRG
jgi:DNA replication initiation complex subunit (GINS family)